MNFTLIFEPVDNSVSMNLTKKKIMQKIKEFIDIPVKFYRHLFSRGVKYTLRKFNKLIRKNL